MTGRTRGIEALLRPRSVAVVGASAREGSNGLTMMRQLLDGGYGGDVAAVNPRYEEVAGVECFPTLADVPFEIDLAILGVPNAALEEQLTAAAAREIPGAVIFASGYPGDPTDTSLIDRLKQIAADNDLTICGGNCMGFANFEHNLRALAFAEPIGNEPGRIAWITHSGSAFTALLHNARGLRFNLAVSTGQEFTTTVADYIDFAVSSEATKLIALFIESVRDPDGFRAALTKAAEADIPVVALKVGRQEESRRLVAAHSGALAGEDAVFDALFDAHGVTRVTTFNEMADTLELFTSERRPGGGGLAAIHDSGGERAHLVDLAADVGVPFARISTDTVSSLSEVLEPGLPPVNPLDAWGTGNDFEKIFLDGSRALLDDPDTAAFAFVVDLAGEEPGWGYAPVAHDAFRETEKPFAVVSNLTSAIDPDAARELRAAGVPLLEDTANGLKAFRHLFELRDHRALPPVAAGASAWTKERWLGKLRTGAPWTEAEGLQMLGAYGVPVAEVRRVYGLDEAIDAADALGYPVVLKMTGATHKSDVGGVRTDIRDEGALVRAHRALTEEFGDELLVQKMADPGVELALGLIRDDQFGPVVMLAAGGVLIELMRDRVLALPPLDDARAHRMIDRLAARRLLDGFRGSAPADVDGLAAAIVGLSRLAVDLGAEIDALDANPIIVGPEGCAVVDAVVETRGTTPAKR